MFHFGSFLFGINVGLIVCMIVVAIFLGIKKKQAEKALQKEVEDEV